jgi:hypothetical protein
MNEYKVGQVLFLIGEQTTKITPIHIIEEVVRTTIDGKEKTYTVQLPDKEKTKADIKKLKGQLFKSTDLLRAHMINNATAAISNMITNAVKISQVAFNITEAELEEMKEQVKIDDEEVHQKSKRDIIKVDLGQGQIANVKMNNFEKIEAK